MERENNSIMEVKKILSSIHNILTERKENTFMSLKVKGLLDENRRDGLEEGCVKFTDDVLGMYTSCVQYLEKWMTPMEEFSPFMWMDMIVNLKRFVESRGDDNEFMGLQVHQKWAKYFEKAKSIAAYSELLKIAQFVFALPAHNANVERVFSLMQSQWTKERNQLSVQSLKGILFLQYNFKDMSCKDFHAHMLSNKKVLRKISSTAKYKWADKKDEEEKPDEEEEKPDEEEDQD
ncbi:hypothetical protein D5F01_LYC15984 [Larimichthys crocea]|uniref:HAT C-terminal dimerisation domain-containing protein n=1 Tax=Larimichthys crocea TaxID=215358 RepID=A0A6G0I496_LARCR|nr:hypothetical protein D5F01_LYC15984 [Larimichthys crocea]